MCSFDNFETFLKVKHWWIMLYGDLALTSPAFLRSPLSFVWIIYRLKIALKFCFFLCCFCSIIIICKNVVKEINKNEPWTLNSQNINLPLPLGGFHWKIMIGMSFELWNYWIEFRSWYSVFIARNLNVFVQIKFDSSIHYFSWSNNQFYIGLDHTKSHYNYK